MVQGVVAQLWHATTGRAPSLPFPRMTYAEAMARFGSDKPDLRFGYELCNVSAALRESGVASLEAALSAGGCVMALALPHATTANPAEALAVVQKQVAAGTALVWKVDAQGQWKGPGAKYLQERARSALAAALGVTGTAATVILLPVASAVGSPAYETACKLLGQARLTLQKSAVPASAPHRFLWVHDFPLFERSDDGGYAAVHHPFTAPHPADLPLMDHEPLRMHGQHYDVVVDGVELGGGSVRIHDAAFQTRVFDLLGVRDPQRTFGHLLRCLRSGCPPHAGAALGLDRLFAVALGKPSIRDVIAFPKSALGNDLMTGAPGVIDESVLAEFGLRYAARPTTSDA